MLTPSPYPPPPIIALPVGSAFGIQSKVCGGVFLRKSQRVNTVGCFRGGAVSMMFDRILNVTLSEEKVSTTVVKKGNLELPLPPNSLDLH